MNRLASETSPYLLQHADNPVDWRPWGDEAFAEAKARGKPMLVSIGYSACHWCHVMAHESFEDPEIARVMNEHLVCVKVDREERPDVDETCMNAIHVMGIPGGWPLNLFLTPDGKPFFGGTYFPPEGRYGRIAWPDLVRRVAELWEDRRAEVTVQADELSSAVVELSDFVTGPALPDADVFTRASDSLSSRFDARHGGFGGSPKFPPHEALTFLFRRARRTGLSREREIAVKTLEAMARGGIYDQVGGGFHRYAVDEKWIVPHFEKMLPDNAQLARLYVEAFQITGDPCFETIARETLDCVLRDLTEADGGFRSATDADSEGREGVYFVWTRTEIDRLLGDDAGIFRRAFGVTEEGNFEDPHHPRRPGEEGMNVLHVVYDAKEIARQDGVSVEETAARLARGRRVLYEARSKRVPPGLDDKIVASWNGLMIGAFAYAGRVLGEPRYIVAAERATDVLLLTMRDASGRLLRTRRGERAKIFAFLEDHAFVADALVDLYEATFEGRRLAAAKDLVDAMNRLFADEKEGGWFHTGADVDPFLTRGKTPTDSSIPSPNAVAARVCLRLSRFTGDAMLRNRAERALLLFRGAMERSPGATLGLLVTLDLLFHEDGEIAIAGDPASPATRELVDVVRRAYRPGVALALRPVSGDAAIERLVPWLAGKTLVDGREAVYLCRNQACEAPITNREELEHALARH